MCPLHLERQGRKRKCVVARNPSKKKVRKQRRNEKWKFEIVCYISRMSKLNGVYGVFIIIEKDYCISCPYWNDSRRHLVPSCLPIQTPLSMGLNCTSVSIGMTKHDINNYSSLDIVSGFLHSFLGENSVDFVEKLNQVCTCKARLGTDGEVMYMLKSLKNRYVTSSSMLQLYFKYLLLYEEQRCNNVISEITVCHPASLDAIHADHLSHIFQRFTQYVVHFDNIILYEIASSVIQSIPIKRSFVFLFHCDIDTFHIYACVYEGSEITVKQHLATNELSKNQLCLHLMKYLSIVNKCEMSPDFIERMSVSCMNALDSFNSQSVRTFVVQLTPVEHVSRIYFESFLEFIRPILEIASSEIQNVINNLKWKLESIDTCIISGNASSVPLYQRWIEFLFPQKRVVVNNHINEFIMSDPKVELIYEMNQLEKISYNLLDTIRLPKEQVNLDQVDQLPEQSTSVKSPEPDVSKLQSSTKIILRPPFKTKRSDSDLVFQDDKPSELVPPSFQINKELLEKDIYDPTAAKKDAEQPVVEKETQAPREECEEENQHFVEKVSESVETKTTGKPKAATKLKAKAAVKPEAEVKAKVEPESKAKGKGKGKGNGRTKSTEKEKAKKGIEKAKMKENKEEKTPTPAATTSTATPATPSTPATTSTSTASATATPATPATAPLNKASKPRGKPGPKPKPKVVAAEPPPKEKEFASDSGSDSTVSMENMEVESEQESEKLVRRSSRLLSARETERGTERKERVQERKTRMQERKEAKKEKMAEKREKIQDKKEKKEREKEKAQEKREKAQEKRERAQEKKEKAQEKKEKTQEKKEKSQEKAVVKGEKRIELPRNARASHNSFPYVLTIPPIILPTKLPIIPFNQHPEKRRYIITIPDLLTFHSQGWNENLISSLYANSQNQEHIPQRNTSHGKLHRYADGSTYIGGIRFGKRQGQGVMTYSDGSVYQGFFRENLRHGKGIMRSKQNRVFFDGVFEMDHPKKGVLTYNNKARYEGTFSNGVPNGEGTYYANGRVASWDGQWVNGEMTGPGTFFFDNGDYYDGSLVQGKRVGSGKVCNKHGTLLFEGTYTNDIENGPGTEYFPDGSYMKVEFSNGVMNGPAVFYDESDREVSRGVFSDNVFSGDGRFFFADGSWYIGHIENNRFNGKGEYHFNESWYCSGSFVNDVCDGLVQFFKGKKLMFEGKLAQNKAYGNGKEYDERGEVIYNGAYKKGQRSGQGRATMENGMVVEGQFRKGEVCGFAKIFDKYGNLLLSAVYSKNRAIGEIKTLYSVCFTIMGVTIFCPERIHDISNPLQS